MRISFALSISAHGARPWHNSRGEFVVVDLALADEVAALNGEAIALKEAVRA
jgi:hypothetical protein